MKIKTRKVPAIKIDEGGFKFFYKEETYLEHSNFIRVIKVLRKNIYPVLMMCYGVVLSLVFNNPLSYLVAGFILGAFFVVMLMEFIYEFKHKNNHP